MVNGILTKLNCNVDINELRDYYNTLKEQYQHLNWSWDRCGNDIVKQWRDAAYSDPANLLTHGWAIQSNLVDLTIPCPPWNISTHPTTDYRNTELAFGIIKRLQEKIPYGYRWGVSVQPPGGKVSLHSDHETEYTVWIPIYTKDTSITFVEDDSHINFELESNGSLYLLDTTIPHFTENKSNEDRVTIIFRLNRKHAYNLFSLLGTL